MKAMGILIGLIAANFAFAFYFGNGYSVAIERSFFQAVAVILVALNT